MPSNAVEVEIRKELGSDIRGNTVTAAALGHYLASDTAAKNNSSWFGGMGLSIQGERTQDHAHALWETKMVINQLKTYGIQVDGSAEQVLKAIPAKSQRVAAR